jgi:hypothetical protein
MSSQIWILNCPDLPEFAIIKFSSYLFKLKRYNTVASYKGSSGKKEESYRTQKNKAKSSEVYK